jgi:hypothetical protein
MFWCIHDGFCACARNDCAPAMLSDLGKAPFDVSPSHHHEIRI